VTDSPSAAGDATVVSGGHAPASTPAGGAAVAPGTRLLHVGPPKTGTTSLQGALHASRPSLLAQGVRYAGPTRHARRAAYAALRRPEYAFLEAPPPARLWDALVEEVRAAPEDRVVLSSEIFTDGDDAAMERVLRDLDPSRVHVVITLRPLVKILASQWQQGLKGGQQLTLDRWLEQVFDGGGGPARLFWHRHRHDRLVQRWASAAGPDRVTVVIVDDRDHGAILRAFEGLLALDAGTLVQAADPANRSMTALEAEVVRRFNVRFAAAGLRGTRAHRLRQSVVRGYLRHHRPTPGEPGLAAPAWALERAAILEREMDVAIVATGVRVMGEIEDLARADPAREPSAAPVRLGTVTRAGIVATVAGIRVASAAGGLVGRVRSRLGLRRRRR
jgi:hypothetical protein